MKKADLVIALTPVGYEIDTFRIINKAMRIPKISRLIDLMTKIGNARRDAVDAHIQAILSHVLACSATL